MPHSWVMTQMPSYRQLRRSQTDRKIAGVCGGIAEYYRIDPNVVRVGFLALSVITGGGFLLAYVIALVVMPDGPAPAQTWQQASAWPPQGSAFPGNPNVQTGQPYPGAPTNPADLRD